MQGTVKDNQYPRSPCSVDVGLKFVLQPLVLLGSLGRVGIGVQDNDMDHPMSVGIKGIAIFVDRLKFCGVGTIRPLGRNGESVDSRRLMTIGDSKVMFIGLKDLKVVPIAFNFMIK